RQVPRTSGGVPGRSREVRKGHAGGDAAGAVSGVCPIAWTLGRTIRRPVELCVIRSRHAERRARPQTEMARRLGISQPTLNRLETASQNMTLETLEKLCRALRCDPGDLFRPGALPRPGRPTKR